jgi:hypothetical protein
MPPCLPSSPTHTFLVMPGHPAVQWHPEKPPFEFGMHEIPHTLDAILVSQHLANNFVDTARRSSHRPESPEQVRSLRAVCRLSGLILASMQCMPRKGE